MVTVIQWKVTCCDNPDSKVHGANMRPTWVLSAPDGPHVGPMNIGIWLKANIVLIHVQLMLLSLFNF